MPWDQTPINFASMNDDKEIGSCSSVWQTSSDMHTCHHHRLSLSVVYFSRSVWDMVHQQQLGYGDTIERYTTTEIVPYVQQVKCSSWAAQSGDLWCFKGNRIWCLNNTRRKNPVSGIVPSNCTDCLELLDLSARIIFPPISDTQKVSEQLSEGEIDMQLSILKESG